MFDRHGATRVIAVLKVRCGLSGEKRNMREDEHVKLRFGPYTPPKLKVGDQVICEIRGFTPVAGFSVGRIPWPWTYRLNARWPFRCRVQGPLILCGDLVRAVRMESNRAVSYWWGVSDGLVTQWRRHLGVPKMNPGSKALFGANARASLTPEVRAKAMESTATPEALAKRLATRRSHPELGPRPWTPEEERLLGTERDKVIAERLGRSPSAVLHRRNRLGIRGFGVSTENKHGRWRWLPLIDPEALRKHRENQGLSRFALAKACRISSSHMSGFETGKVQRIMPKTLGKLSAVLKCPADALVRPTATSILPNFRTDGRLV